MAILVTGGAGYIGSVVVEQLLSYKERVVVVDDLSRGHRQAVEEGVAFYQGDVGDRGLIARIIRDHEIEACIHFAALAYVGESVKNPMAYFENNVEKGIVLIGSLVRAGVLSFVFSSSCTIYGEPDETPIVEEAPKWPTHPYGWSKLLLERLLHSYDTAYGLKFVALRYFNAAGASQKHGEDHEPETHLIANVLRVASGKLNDVPVFGSAYPTPDGTAIRDYIHVSDLADAHIRALHHLREDGSSEFLNLGTGRGYSVLEVIECARQVTAKSISARLEAARSGDPSRLIANASKAGRVLGWSPTKPDLPFIVRSAWDWHLRHPQGYASK
jgi:UDP-glucose 4-epimerase